MKSLTILILCSIFGASLASCQDSIEGEIIPTANTEKEESSGQSGDMEPDSSLDARMSPARAGNDSG